MLQRRSAMMHARTAGHSSMRHLHCCVSVSVLTMCSACLPALQATVRDLYQAKDLGTFSSSFAGVVMPRDVLPLRITPTSEPSVRSSPGGSLQGTGSGRSVRDDGWRPWHENEYIQRHARRRSSAEVQSAVRASRAARMKRAVEGTAVSVY